MAAKLRVEFFDFAILVKFRLFFIKLLGPVYMKKGGGVRVLWIEDFGQNWEWIMDF